MRRRRFLQFLGASALTGLSGFVGSSARARAAEGKDGRDGVPENRADLVAALENAKRSARPMVAWIVPADRQQHYERGMTFGAWLLDPAAHVSGRFAEVDLVCVPWEALESRISSVARGEREPWLVWVEWVKESWRTRVFDDELPPRRRGVLSPGRGTADSEHADEAGSMARDAERSRALHAFLDSCLDDDAAARAERVLAALGALEREGLAKWKEAAEWDDSSLEPELLRKAASWIRAQVPANGQARLRRKLGRLAAERLLAAPPAGSEWYVSFGCGGEYRTGPERQSPLCGMGFFSEQGRTFLDFYVES